MNPFTRFLRQWLSGPEEISPLVEHSDALEALVIRVYKAGEASSADEAEYQALRSWLEGNYPAWQQVLAPYWQEARVAGEPVAADPLLRLLRADTAAEFVGDWGAMQQLPALREALNRCVLARAQEK